MGLRDTRGLDVESVVATILTHTSALASTRVPLTAALGRVLSEDVFADRDAPPFDRVAMDGFAVRGVDATDEASLDVVGLVRAGAWPSVSVGKGQAAEVTTGAPLPPGADAVIPVEQTRALAKGRVQLLGGVQLGANVAGRGTEARQGERVLAAGRRIDPAAIAVLAAFGAAEVSVAVRPRVAVVVTGDEVVAVGESPGPARIRDSNGPVVAALVREAGADVCDLGIVPDDEHRLREVLDAGLAADVLVVCGGVSAGPFDLVRNSLDALGVLRHVNRVNIKPGAPFVFGQRGETLVFGLPGNPVAVQVTFELFVRPALLAMQGASGDPRVTVEVELAEGVTTKAGRTAYLPALIRAEGHRFVARPIPTRGSADIVAHAQANGLIIVDAAAPAAAGEWVRGQLLAGGGSMGGDS